MYRSAATAYYPLHLFRYKVTEGNMRILKNDNNICKVWFYTSIISSFSHLCLCLSSSSLSLPFYFFLASIFCFYISLSLCLFHIIFWWNIVKYNSIMLPAHWVSVEKLFEDAVCTARWDCRLRYERWIGKSWRRDLDLFEILSLVSSGKMLICIL
jgi:hypothetical protein